MSLTKRVSIYTAVIWVCLLAFVVIVRGFSLTLGSVKPEAIALTFMMTLPFALGASATLIFIVWALERRRAARSNAS